MDAIDALLLVAGWSAGTVLLWRLRVPDRLEPGDRPVEPLLSRTSVIVPARDEARSLPVLLTSLRAQVHQPLEVVVVDDGSTDATADLATGAGATVVEAGEPPPGWLGKPWACQRGIEVASGDRFVFLDADTRLARDGLARVVATGAARTPDGLLSVQPYHEVPAAYEQLSALCNVVPVLASGMGAPGDRPATLAFGPCLVTTRGALDRAGGFAAVRGALTEDVELARAYRAADLDVRCLGGGSTVRFRMYPGGLGSLVQGWSKNLAAGAGRAPLVPTVGAVAWVATLVAVAWAGIREIAGWAAGAGAPSVAAALAWTAVAAQLWWMLRRLGSFRWWCAVVFPVPLAVFVVLFARSVLLRGFGRPVTWRGRRVDTRSGRR